MILLRWFVIDVDDVNSPHDVMLLHTQLAHRMMLIYAAAFAYRLRVYLRISGIFKCYSLLVLCLDVDTVHQISSRTILAKQKLTTTRAKLCSLRLFFQTYGLLSTVLC